MADDKSALERFFSAYAQMSRADQREFAKELFAKCGETPEQILADIAECCKRHGKSVRDVLVEGACSEELSEIELGEALDLLAEMDELVGQTTKFTQ